MGVKKKRKKIGKRTSTRTTRICQRFYAGIDIFFVSLSSIDSGSTRNFRRNCVHRVIPTEMGRGRRYGEEKKRRKKKKGGEGDPLSGGREWKNSTSAGGDLCRILLDVEF